MLSSCNAAKARMRHHRERHWLLWRKCRCYRCGNRVSESVFNIVVRWIATDELLFKRLAIAATEMPNLVVVVFRLENSSNALVLRAVRAGGLFLLDGER